MSFPIVRGESPAKGRKRTVI